MALKAGTLYTTRLVKTPVLTFTPPTSQWTAADQVACGEDLGTVALMSDDGRMFLVSTPDLTVEEAITVLGDGPFTSTSVSDTGIAGWIGQRFRGELDRATPVIQLGVVLPYHTITEDVLDAPDEGPLEPASQIEINVLDTGSGVLSIVLVVAENGSMETFGADALALAETITITSTKDEADPSC